MSGKIFSALVILGWGGLLLARPATEFLAGDEFLLLERDYLAVKDGLVADDSWATALGASRFRLHLFDWKKRYPLCRNLLKLPMAELDQISGTGDLAIQRHHFKNLSDWLLKSLIFFPRLPIHLYIQRCPMAFHGEGAFWLSGHGEVWNPYFGAQMPKCGRVIGEIQGEAELTPLPLGFQPQRIGGPNHVHGCHGPGR
jgi:hypothetical protein